MKTICIAFAAILSISTSAFAAATRVNCNLNDAAHATLSRAEKIAAEYIAKYAVASLKAKGINIDVSSATFLPGVDDVLVSAVDGTVLRVGGGVPSLVGKETTDNEGNIIACTAILDFDSETEIDNEATGNQVIPAIAHSPRIAGVPLFNF
jgi:hypothetical protein